MNPATWPVRAKGPHTVVLDPDVRKLTNQDLHVVQAALLEGGAPDEVAVLYHGEGVTVALDDLTQTEATGLGWEQLILPRREEARRAPRLPGHLTLHWGEPERFNVAHLDPRIWPYLHDPRLDAENCLTVLDGNDVVGWAPVVRLSPSTSQFRFTFLQPGLYDHEPTRRSILRLGMASRMVNRQLALGRAVISWIPDDGDAINAYKAQVAQAARSTYWLMRKVRRDLAPRPTT